MKALALGQGRAAGPGAQRSSPQRARQVGGARGQHEQQAAHRAAAFVRGEHGLSTGLSSAPPAAFVLRASPGRPLPNSLRSALECAFDAELAAVRVHDDAASHAAARAIGANAFASGTHLYFGAGRYEPASAAGQALVAHEVTHVLQQCGRAASNERWSATPRSGSGAVQCDDDPNADRLVPFLKTPAALAALGERHGAHSAADDSLRQLIAVVEHESGGSLPRWQVSAIGKRLIQIASDGGFDVQVNAQVSRVALSLPAQGYLVDCLKVCGKDEHFEAVAKLLDADTGFALRTSFGPRTDLRSYLDKHRGEDWVAKAFGYPALARIWPYVFINTFEQYMLNPGRPRQSLYGLQKLLDTELSNIDGTASGLLVSDRVVLAVELLERYDRRRMEMLAQMDVLLKKVSAGDGAPTQRLVAAHLLVDWLQRQQAAARTPTWKNMLERMSRVAGDAAAYWLQVRSDWGGPSKKLAAMGSLRSDGSLHALWGGLSDKIDRLPFGGPAFEPLHRLMRGLAAPDGVYGLDAAGALTSLPDAAGYERRIFGFADALGLRANPSGNVLLALQVRLIGLYERSSTLLKGEEARALGVAIWWLLELQPKLLDYRAAADTDAKRGHADQRLAHRIALVNQIGVFSQMAGWDDTLQAAARIRRGDDITASRLIVRSPWRLDEGAGVEQMPADLGGRPVFDNYAFTAHDVVRYFRARRLASITDAVRAQVDRTRADAKAKLDLEAIEKVVRAAPRPWRCVVPDYTLVLKPSELLPVGGKGNPKLPSAFSLIKASPKSMHDLRSLATLKNLGNVFYYSALREKTQPLFAWIFPDIAPLIARLRAVDPFASALGGPGIDQLTDEQWMAELTKRAEGGKLVALGKDALRLAIDKELAADVGAEESSLESALREFTIVLRREWRQTLAADLVRYSKSRTFKNRDVPTGTVKGIDWFYVQARPNADASAQQALLLLSLGAELEDAFPNVRTAAHAPASLHYTLTQAVAFADGELSKAAAGDKAYARALRPLLHSNAADPRQDESFAGFLAQRDRLSALAGRIETARVEMQESRGFGSDDARTLRAVGYSERLEPGRKNAIEVDGDEWELVQVHRKFIYHPPLGNSVVTDKSARPLLKWGDDALPWDGQPLASFLVNGLEYELLASKDEVPKLTHLHEALWQYALRRRMEELSGALEAGAMFIVDVMELIPGLGQKLMLLRLTGQTAAFLDHELPMIVDAVQGDPIAFLKETGDKLVKNYLTIEGFAAFVLLGEGDSPLDELRKPRPAKAHKQRLHGKLARIINLLRKLGMRLADAMQWLQLRVARPVRSLQSTVATRPMLGWVLHKGMEIALGIPAFAPADPADKAAHEQQRRLAVIDQLAPGGAAPQGASLDDTEAHGRSQIALVEAQIQQAGAEFKEQFEARLELLRQARLPGEVVPLGLLGQFIVEFFLSRLGAKVRIAKKLLEGTDAYKRVVARIGAVVGDQFRDTALDPNKHWRESVLARVEGQVVGARNELVDTIYGLTDRVADQAGLDAMRLARPARKAPGGFLEPTEFPAEELDLAPRDDSEVPASGRLAELPTTAGQPLAARVRVAEESRFGHDFRHVRTHGDEQSGDALANLHADAATSGSHIFLRPGLRATEGEGARLLRHELTHVLQQAGPRPLGQPHAQRPMRGRRGRGLKFDAMREAAAEAMARADKKVAREPIDVQAGAEGVQPSLEPTAVKLLEMFTTLPSVKDFEQAPVAADKGSITTAELLLQALHQRLKQKLPGDFLDFAKPVDVHIVKHVEDTPLSADMRKIAGLAQKPIKGARGKKAKTELDFETLVTLFEAVVFLRSGIAMQIKASNGKPPTIDKLTVTYVHLGLIAPGVPGSTPLWDLVMKNTAKLNDNDDPKLVRLELHAWLNFMGPDPFVWKTGQRAYQFSDDFVEAFGKRRARRKPETVKNLPEKGSKPPEDPKDIPKFKNEYLSPTGQQGIGLRIGLHGSGLGKQKGTDRESHHIVQYLLVQFFANDNRVKAWPAGTTPPGLKRVTGGVDSFTGATAKTLNFKALDPGGAGNRGAAMPAILVSADTHKRGRIHVERESQWSGDTEDSDSDSGQGRSTQGYAIRAEFTRQQIKHLGTHDAAPGWAAKMKTPANADLLHKAIVGTYHWMHGIMLPALEGALRTREVAYYRAVAARIPKAVDPATGVLRAPYKLDTAELAAVFARAKRYTNEVMANPHGWPAP